MIITKEKLRARIEKLAEEKDWWEYGNENAYKEGATQMAEALVLLADALESAKEGFYLILIQNENFPEDATEERDRLSHEYNIKTKKALADAARLLGLVRKRGVK